MQIKNTAFTESQLASLESKINERLFKSGMRNPDVNILIVEDHELFRKILKNSLPRQYTCHTAKDGHEAIELYSQYAHNIVFMDIHLPDMNGHDIAALIKTYDPDSFIVMVTANNYDKDVETAHTNKVQGFITKPYNKQKILDALDLYTKMQNKKFERSRI